MLYESNEKALRLSLFQCRNARRSHFICGAMQFGARYRLRHCTAPVETGREMCNYLYLCPRGRTRPNENLPFKSHFGSTYFLSVAMAGAACGRSAAGGRAQAAGYRKFSPPFSGKRKHPLLSYIHFVHRYGLNSCFSSTPPFLLRTSSLAEERVAGFQDVEQRER